MAADKREAILAAATQSFVRHGFKRVTLGEIAREAGMSRPALYLIFPNKEAIFVAVLRRWAERAVAQINAELARLESPVERLRFAFEVWTVRPYELLHQHPDARDLIEAPPEFARKAYHAVYREFERVLARILRDTGAGGEEVGDVAGMLAGASTGFKASAATPRELRRLIHTAIDAALLLVQTARREQPIANR